jgi:hypothetical protein
MTHHTDEKMNSEKFWGRVNKGTQALHNVSTHLRFTRICFHPPLVGFCIPLLIVSRYIFTR